MAAQRRALRTASEKLRSRTSFSATAVQHSPATRVNRYIGRLIEARQTESETTDLNYFTLFYRNRDRECKVRVTAADTPLARLRVCMLIKLQLSSLRVISTVTLHSLLLTLFLPISLCRTLFFCGVCVCGRGGGGEDNDLGKSESYT